MKISELHIFQHDLPVENAPYTMSYGEVWALDTTLVKIVTDTGVEGWGETCPLGPVYAPAHAFGARAALAEMGPNLIGCEVLPLSVHRRMDQLLMGHSYAKAAIDIAVHDALAKHLGLRVADLLGGAATERVPSYYAIGIETPEDAARIAREKVDDGFPRLQIKVGGRDPEIDIAVIRKVWEVIGGRGIGLAIDANRGWNTRDALNVSRSCQDIPMIIEQPCGSKDELGALRTLVRHPIYMDESATGIDVVLNAAATGLVDGFGMKVTRLGGLHPMTTFRDICAARNLPHTCDDAWGGDILTAACVHIGATVRPDLNDGVWIASPYIEGNYDPDAGLALEHGHINLPKGTGLGVRPNEALFGNALESF
ncbi:mandelate racemase (plasmid) [Phaeobacter inhibens]|uniref:mandelate racemase/muconate lactonizing enzyme family protein n=1 Tax=Phaeobacter inhibens TaxID=221822 RepID=UPI000971B702|nr:enolase C-terminal domain-like protein [Phaeobacter inhibens]APX18085.1 mandelate racemase [Phaeobacter inhibens]